jgi:hypothetical protein
VKKRRRRRRRRKINLYFWGWSGKKNARKYDPVLKGKTQFYLPPCR